MPDWQDTRDHLRLVELSVADVSRWEIIGQRLEHMSPELLREIASVRANPTKHSLHIAANAARVAAERVDEPLKSETIALAEELEKRSI